MAQTPLPSLVAARLTRWNAAHPEHKIDLRAVNAVGQQEGYSGRIGDAGSSFGPFQLHYGGAYPTSAPRANPAQSQAWATSAPGIDYALSGIGNVAGGLQGPAAVKAIVARFERPANIPGETARALAAYGGAGAGPVSPLAPAAAAPVAAAPVLQPRSSLPGLLSALGTSGGDYSGFYATLGKAMQAQAAAPQAAPPVRTLPLEPGQTLNASTMPLRQGQTIANAALKRLGQPYQWGGNPAGRTDCSGLLQASAKAAGVNISRTTYTQFKQGTPVPLSQLKPGDAVFSEPTAQGPGHVSIYIGGGRVVEEPHTGASVSIRTLDGNRGIVGARRY